jgi:mono/diheme cytochrome c family protein
MRPALLAAPALAALLAWPFPAAAGDLERGRVLYESRCGGCHAESVHGRAKRDASSYAEVRAWVRRWSGNLGLGWSEEEVADVAAYLNGRYYGFACPPAECRATGRLGKDSPVAALDGRVR